MNLCIINMTISLALLFSCGLGSPDDEKRSIAKNEDAIGDEDNNTHSGKDGKDSKKDGKEANPDGKEAEKDAKVGDNKMQEPVFEKLDPNKAPGENFDLSAWKLTLPVDEDGNFSGKSVEVKPIPADYTSEDYFYTSSDGGMVFTTPANGARTSTNTKYPRTELRELNASGANIEWTVEQGGLLRATLAVTALPDADGGGKGRIIVGQIHGPDDELCRLYYDNGNLYFYNDKAGSNEEEQKFQLEANGKNPNIPLNEKFSYEIKVDPDSKTLVVSVKDKAGTVFTATDPISAFWPGKALYFKAGNYLQVSNHPDAGTRGSGSGTVIFYALPKPTH